MPFRRCQKPTVVRSRCSYCLATASQRKRHLPDASSTADQNERWETTTGLGTRLALEAARWPWADGCKPLQDRQRPFTRGPIGTFGTLTSSHEERTHGVLLVGEYQRPLPVDDNAGEQSSPTWRAPRGLHTLAFSPCHDHHIPRTYFPATPPRCRACVRAFGIASMSESLPAVRGRPFDAARHRSCCRS